MKRGVRSFLGEVITREGRRVALCNAKKVGSRFQTQTY